MARRGGDDGVWSKTAADAVDDTKSETPESDDTGAFKWEVSDFEGLRTVMAPASQRRDRVRRQAEKSLRNVFPVEGTNYIMELEDVAVQEKEYTLADVKRAVLERGSLTEPIKGTIVIKEKGTGKVLDRSKRTLAQLPYMTEQHSFVISGNPYVVSNQLRVKPGVYTRQRDNGALEGAFNLGRGANFRTYMEPAQGVFYLQYASSKIPAWPVLKALGVTDAELEKAWGAKLVEKNKLSPRQSRDAVAKLYAKVVPESMKVSGATPAQMVEALKETYDRTVLDPTVTKVTLGSEYDRVKPQAILDSTRKLLRVYKGEEPEDDRDDLRFKTMHTVDTFIKERIEKDAARGILGRAKMKLNRTASPKVDQVLGTAPFSAPLRGLLTGSQLSTAPSQINPVEIADTAAKVTSLGEGGISSLRSVPETTRGQHASHLGILDPIRTPESGGVGVDLRVAMHTAVDARGNMFTPLKNVKTGKVEYVSAQEIANKRVAFEKTDLSKPTVPVMYKGQVTDAKSSAVDYMIPNTNAKLSPATSLVPMIGNSQGNRLIMGSKQQTQALPLVNREAPLVQVDAGDGRSVEEIIAGWHLPRASVDGTVTKIDKEAGVVYVKPKDGGKEVKHEFAVNYPFASKTRLHHDIQVKVGDTVKKDQRLGDSNFTRDGVQASGVNLTTAYMAYHGANSNDAVVISETAAKKKLVSEHVYRETLDIHPDIVSSKTVHQKYFGTKYAPDQYKRLDDTGVIRKGQKVNPGELLIAAVAKRGASAQDQMLGRMSKSLVRPYLDRGITWDHGHEGEVVDVVRTPKAVTVLVHTSEPMHVGDKLCFDEDTQVLTQRGWVGVAHVSMHDKVCTLQDGEHIVYLHPDSKHSYPVGGSMYRIESQQIDLHVTTSHKMYVQPRGHDTYELLEAKEIAGKRVRYKKDGVWSGCSPSALVLPALRVKAGQGGQGWRWLPEKKMPPATYCMLLGAFLSEGNIVNQPASGSYGIDITQIKEPHRQRLLDELDRLEVPYSQHGSGSKVRIYSKQLLDHFAPLGKAWEKYIPSAVFDFGREDLQVLFDWMMWGDGHTTCDGRPVCYTTTSAQLADDVQRLCLHIGKAANIRVRAATQGEIKGAAYEFRPRYDVRVINTKLRPQVNHGHATTQSAQTEEIVEGYEAPVHCLTVPGHVLYVRRGGKPCWSGNSGRYGNKGVVAKIIPDDQMPRRPNGEPVDLILTSAGVVSRINPSQVIERALGKVAQKTGKPVKVEQFPKESMVEFAKRQLKEHGVEDKETLFDPVTGREIPGIAVGPTYQFKLFKSTDTNFGARGVGPYDVNEQPTRGGDAGAKSVGRLDFYALVAHGASGIIQEASSVRGTRNDEFWKRVQTGMPEGPVKPAFAWQKFQAMLTGSGINVEKKDSQVSLAPLTDADVLKLAPRAVENAGVVKVKSTKDGATIVPEKGGLFDPVITGGVGGTKWSRIDLAEPVVNPVFENAAKGILGVTSKEFDRMQFEEGGAAVKSKLNSIDLATRRTEIEREIKHHLSRGPGGEAEVDKRVKAVKAIRALETRGLKAGDAYVTTTVPVVPPVMRSVVGGADGSLMVSDPNFLYKDLALINSTIKETPEELRDLEDPVERRKALKGAVGAVYGTHEAVNKKTRARGVRGFMTQIVGERTPKDGFFHSKLLRRRVDLSGRGTIAPDPSLGIDEVGLPWEMLWTQYAPFVIGNLTKKGYPAVRAKQMVEERHVTAKRELLDEMQRRPIFMNRAPTLHRYNVVAAYPKGVDGKTIFISPYYENLGNADYDGDAMQVHVPATQRAVADAKRMTISRLALADGGRDSVLAAPQHEAIIGAFIATAPPEPGKAPKVYKTKADALAAYHRGEIKANTPIKILDTKSAFKGVRHGAP